MAEVPGRNFVYVTCRCCAITYRRWHYTLHTKTVTDWEHRLEFDRMQRMTLQLYKSQMLEQLKIRIVFGAGQNKLGIEANGQ
jgi:hypothetical protein